MQIEAVVRKFRTTASDGKNYQVLHYNLDMVIAVDVAETLLVTDEYKAYKNMNSVIPHYSISHSKEYAQGDIHTNTIESFWAILKRGLMGQFHWVSKKHLNLYIDEFCYRYNARNSSSSVVFERTLYNMI